MVPEGVYHRSTWAACARPRLVLPKKKWNRSADRYRVTSAARLAPAASGARPCQAAVTIRHARRAPRRARAAHCEAWGSHRRRRRHRADLRHPQSARGRPRAPPLPSGPQRELSHNWHASRSARVAPAEARRQRDSHRVAVARRGPSHPVRPRAEPPPRARPAARALPHHLRVTEAPVDRGLNWADWAAPLQAAGLFRQEAAARRHRLGHRRWRDARKERATTAA